MTDSSWAARRGARRARSALVGLLARDTDRDSARTVAVLGTARSGTTWLGDLLADGLRARIVFEPFNPDRVRAAARFGSMPYRRPDARDEALLAHCRRVFEGRLRGLWVDREARWLRPHGRVVKSVRAHLMLGWLARTFPEVARILIVREPLAVVRSRLAAGWAPEPDVDAMLANPQLVEDHLGADHDWARALATPEERTALIWALVADRARGFSGLRQARVRGAARPAPFRGRIALPDLAAAPPAVAAAVASDRCPGAHRFPDTRR